MLGPAMFQQQENELAFVGVLVDPRCFETLVLCEELFYNQKKSTALFLLILGTSKEASEATIGPRISTTGKSNKNK